MENQIISVESTFWKSLLISENEMWLSQSNIGSYDEFAEGIQKTGMMKSSYSYPLSSVSEISYNEASESVKVHYQDEKGKNKKVNLGFGDEARSNQFGEFLGDKLGLQKSQVQEGQTKPLLLNLLYLIITIGGTYFLATLDDTSELTDSSSRRTRNRGAFLKLIVDTVGQTGVIIIGSLISLYFIYQLYNRFKNPANEVVFKR